MHLPHWLLVSLIVVSTGAPRGAGLAVGGYAKADGGDVQDTDSFALSVEFPISLMIHSPF
jgi:hypothetical protein